MAEPVEVAKYVADPCSALTDTQEQEFAVTSSKKNGDDEGVTCRWKVGDGSTSFSVSFPIKNRNGLDNLYQLNNTVGWAYWEPTEIDGYPAVYAATNDHRSTGSCELAVGVRDDSFFLAAVDSRAGSDACLAVGNVAKAVVQTLKAGA